MKQTNLVLVRHGQSEWNKKNLFTGWKDPNLTDLGIEEAKKAGNLLKERGLAFDIMFTSDLFRAQETGRIILEQMNLGHIEVVKDQSLNERNYGDLAGLNKDEARVKWGEEQVQIWRRSYDKGPPSGETLKETGERVIPYYKKEIGPLIAEGSNVVIAAHGNSLRSLIKFLDGVSDEDIVKLEIPTGAPIHYIFDHAGNILSRNNLIE